MQGRPPRHESQRLEKGGHGHYTMEGTDKSGFASDISFRFLLGTLERLEKTKLRRILPFFWQ